MAYRELDTAMREDASSSRTAQPTKLSLAQLASLAIGVALLLASFLIPLGFAIAEHGLAGAGVVVGGLVIYLLAIRGLLALRAWWDARRPNYARDALARSTEEFLARIEDEQIRARVFLPPMASVATTDREDEESSRATTWCRATSFDK